MNPLDYLLMWSATIAFTALCDLFWVHKLRPLLADVYGWPDLDPEDVIPTSAWVGVLVVTGLLFFIVPWVGHAAGF